MLKKTFYCLLVLISISQSCNEPAKQLSTSSDKVLNDVKAWTNRASKSSSIAKNERDLASPIFSWEDTKVQSIGPNLFVISTPVLNKSRTGRSAFQMVNVWIKGKIRGFIIELIPDQAYIDKAKFVLDNKFSGQIKTLSVSGKRLRTHKYVNGKEVDFYKGAISSLRVQEEGGTGDDGDPESGAGDGGDGGDGDGGENDDECPGCPNVLDTVVITGASYDPSSNSYTIFIDTGSGGGSGGSSSSIPPTITLGFGNPAQQIPLAGIRLYAEKKFGKPSALGAFRSDTPPGYTLVNGKFVDADGNVAAAVTLPSQTTPGTYDIFLSPSVMSSMGNLFYALGHEYVHVYDNMTYGYPTTQAAYEATEYNAYGWSIAAAIANGDPNAANFYRNVQSQFTPDPNHNYNYQNYNLATKYP